MLIGEILSDKDGAGASGVFGKSGVSGINKLSFVLAN